MSKDGWARQWRGFFGLSVDGKVLEVLSRLYLEEIRHATILAQHAAAMRYPQFRAKLLEIAEQENRHSQWISEKIEALGGSLPVIRPVPLPDGNNWELLLEDSNSEARYADELLEQAMRLESESPDIADLLRRIGEDEHNQCDEIRKMLMRSDPLSRCAA